jgi:tetratricopeptide (TPR) repeat protein
MFQSGQKFGQYRLVRKIAKGGFGEVWLAEKESSIITRTVAVKLPHAGQVDIEAIRQEAALWEQASGHPNVLPLLDADIYDGQIVIASEYVEGGSLADRLRKDGKLPIEEAVQIVIGILNGLEFLHSKNIVHRDIKPANILMQDGVPRLTDFGISRAVENTLVSSKVVGTHPYMSPESFEGFRSVQTDVWSVGVLLYHLSTGKLPFPLGQPSQIMYSVLLNEPAPLPDEIPLELQKIIFKALEKDRELNGQPPRRYQSAAEMRADLENFLKWFSSPDKNAASPFETVKVYADAGAVEQATRMRIPLAGGNNFLARLRHALVNRNFTPAMVLTAILGVGIVVMLLSVLLFSGRANSDSANGAAANSADSNRNGNSDFVAADDAAIRAAREFHRQGDEFYARKRYEKAIETYTLAVELNPNDYALYNNRGAAYHANGEFQKAIADYTRAAELNPYHFSAYNNRGAAYEDLGDIERAVADFRKALELDPENKQAKNNLKRILKEK